MNRDNQSIIKPFWSWNDKLQKDELVEQIDTMKQNGIDGFFMHARGGLKTEYMSDEWFDMIGACLDRADELEMEAWAYDENGWPSGFANGIVPRMGEDYQQKWLVCSVYGEEKHENVIGYYKLFGDKFKRCDSSEDGCVVISYDINRYYIDAFNFDAIHEFIELTHEKYYERFKDRFGSSLKGFFTDEPQYGNNGHAPWSHVFEAEFYKRYNYSLIENLPLIFFEKAGYEKFRSDFYNLVSDLFRINFVKQMYDWCDEHSCMLTGHMMNEDSLMEQMYSTAGVMSCYEYFHEPGVDWLGRRIDSPLVERELGYKKDSPLIPKQLGSVAAQLGKKTLTETYALCGWDVSINELRWIAQWHYVNGVTSLCPHLEAYSIRGARKRDYPASLFSQLPWFKDCYGDFSRYFTRLGRILDSGKEYAPLLVVHAMQSAFIAYNPSDKSAIHEIDDIFISITNKLNDRQISHHYGDEIIMLRYAKVDGRYLVVGNCRYDMVLLPSLIGVSSNTTDLLLRFAKNGGNVYYFGELPKFENGVHTERMSELCSLCHKVESLDALSEMQNIKVYENGSFAEMLHVTQREMPDMSRVVYAVNLRRDKRNVMIQISGEHSLVEIDIVNDREKPIVSRIENGKTIFEIEFDEYSAYLFKTVPYKELTECYEETEYITLQNNFDIVSADKNALTLDRCEYRIDGGEWQPSISIIKLHNKLLSLRKPCDLEMRFSFEIDIEFDFDSLELAVETPDIYSFEINGKEVRFKESGYYIDKSFRKTNIGSLVKKGVNIIVMRCRFEQSEEVYRVLSTPDIHESEINKLTYDTEIESIYIIGDFGVKMSGGYTYGENKTIFGGVDFNLTKRPERVEIYDITHQGFWFFAGKMKLKQRLDLRLDKKKRYALKLKNLNAPAAIVSINGKEDRKFLFSPYVLDITDSLSYDDDNYIEITLLSGNRNLLGPHHRPYGESHFVGPSTFTDIAGWADNPNEEQWTDKFSFVVFGIEI